MATIDYKQKIKDYMNSSEVDTLYKSMLNNLFPELKDSEDERIKKSLIDYFNRFKSSDMWNESFSFGDVVSWLEQQGEQKPTAEEVLIKAGLKLYKDGNQWCVLVGDNIQEGVCGFGDTIEDALYSFLKNVCKTKQKPVEWSVEDNNCLSTIIANFSKCAGKSVSKDEWMRCNDFLNSLKDRLQPQPKQEWSEEDNQTINDIITLIEYGALSKDEKQYYINKLKSLRHQKQWKPTEEQIDSLIGMIEKCESEWDYDESVGRELLEQLKAL